MSNVDIAVACVLLAAATLVFIFNVHLGPSDNTAHRTKLDQLMERRDATYDNLRDLRFEYRAGKYSEKDYEEVKQSLELDVARVLVQMDEATGNTPTPAARQAATERHRS